MPKNYTYSRRVKCEGDDLGTIALKWYEPTVDGHEELMTEVGDSDAMMGELVRVTAESLLTTKVNKIRGQHVKVKQAFVKHNGMVADWAVLNDIKGYTFAISSGRGTTLHKTYITAHLVEAMTAAGKTAAFDPDVVAAAKKAWNEAYKN